MSAFETDWTCLAGRTIIQNHFTVISMNLKWSKQSKCIIIEKHVMRFGDGMKMFTNT